MWKPNCGKIYTMYGSCFLCGNSGEGKSTLCATVVFCVETQVRGNIHYMQQLFSVWKPRCREIYTMRSSCFLCGNPGAGKSTLCTAIVFRVEIRARGNLHYVQQLFVSCMETRVRGNLHYVQQLFPVWNPGCGEIYTMYSSCFLCGNPGVRYTMCSNCFLCGNPGAGKSTLCTAIVLCVETRVRGNLHYVQQLFSVWKPGCGEIYTMCSSCFLCGNPGVGKSTLCAAIVSCVETRVRGNLRYVQQLFPVWKPGCEEIYTMCNNFFLCGNPGVGKSTLCAAVVSCVETRVWGNLYYVQQLFPVWKSGCGEIYAMYSNCFMCGNSSAGKSTLCATIVFCVETRVWGNLHYVQQLFPVWKSGCGEIYAMCSSCFPCGNPGVGKFTPCAAVVSRVETRKTRRSRRKTFPYPKNNVPVFHPVRCLFVFFCLFVCLLFCFVLFVLFVCFFFVLFLIMLFLVL